MFKGASSISLDAKGRLSVPTRHRDELSASTAGQLTVTSHPHGYLMLFPRAAWDDFSQRVVATAAEGQWWRRILLGSAMDVELDGTGRVLISPELRESACLTKEVMLLGVGTHFELWDKETYQAKVAAAKQQPMPDVFKDFSF